MSNYEFDGITLTNIYFSNVEVRVYALKRYQRYEYVNTLNSFSNLKIPINSYDYLMILVKPTSSVRIGTFRASASLYQDSGLSGGAIAGIVIGSVAFVAIIFIICV